MRYISKVAALAICIIVGAVAVSAASAHIIGPVGKRVLQSPGLCINDTLTLTHGAGGGHIYGETETSQDASYGILNVGFSIPCGQNRSMSPGYMAADVHYWFWGAYANQWTICSDTGWSFNTSTTSRFTPQWEMTYSDNNGRHAPCGDGYYWTEEAGLVYDGGWQPFNGSGWINLGDTAWHWFTWWN